jgi:hypothetical protein
MKQAKKSLYDFWPRWFCFYAGQHTHPEIIQASAHDTKLPEKTKNL